MDLHTRKRKLVDYSNSITPIRKLAIVSEGITVQEENNLNTHNQRHGFNEGDAEKITKEAIAESDKKYEEVRRKEKKRSQKYSILNEEENEDEEDNDADDYEDINFNNEDNNEGCDTINENNNNINNILKNKNFNEKECQEVNINDSKEIVWFSTDYIEDIITYEVHKESNYHLSENFCRKYDVNPTGREILIDWLIGVQIHLKADNSTLHLAVALLDTLLDSIRIPLNDLQGAAIASFWVAYKFIHGSLSMKTLLGLCAGSVTKRMMENNEILVLQTSRLIQAGGSLTVFFNYFLYKIFGYKFPPEIYYCGLYFIEIMLLQFIFVDCPAYEKAVTAVFTALVVFNSSDRFDLINVSNFIKKRKLHHVYRRLMRSLRLMYKDKSSLKNSNVYRKYKSSRYLKISVHQNLKRLASS